MSSNPQQVLAQSVLVIACGALAHDLVRVKALNQWRHMDIQCLPAELHNHPQKIPEAVRNKIEQNRHKYHSIFVAYSDCGTGGLLDAVLQQYGIERLPGAHCYEMFSGAKKFKALHEAELGTFYLTDFLVTHFDRLIIKGLALDRFPQLKDQFFNNYKKLVYLAQLDDMEIDKKARNAANYLELEYQRVLTRDQHFEAALSVQIGSVRH
ncbi:DUF1638 domain-containing protein [Candidatus Spongiihabitans sp.]|uniref:DUF1638 domain-containing protein n=1 Tax=Candidatus Spongiihabitans sp. TaxID=3101308 RepID=UPI003C703373